MQLFSRVMSLGSAAVPDEPEIDGMPGSDVLEEVLSAVGVEEDPTVSQENEAIELIDEATRIGVVNALEELAADVAYMAGVAMQHGITAGELAPPGTSDLVRAVVQRVAQEGVLRD